MTAKPTTDHPLFEGPCHGGPLDGETATSRFPAGFVLADKLGGRAWIYDRRDDGAYVVRGGDTDPARELDHTRALAAALGQEYDVIAAAGGAHPGTRSSPATRAGRMRRARPSSAVWRSAP